MLDENLDEMVVNEEGDAELTLSEEEEVSDKDTDELEDDELDVIRIEGETPPEQEEVKGAPQWAKDLRKINKSKNEEIRTLRAELERAKTEPKQAVSLPQKPKLEDFDYDPDEFETALEQWHGKKLEHDAQEKENAKAVEAQQKEWQDTVDNYEKTKSSLKVRDYDVAEEVVVSKLSMAQQAIILQGASNPAMLVYALGKSKGKIDELSKITNPVKFAFALAELQGKLSIERKSAPSPEKVVKGSASSSSSDSTLDRLREEATKSGDMSKLMAYKRSLKK